MRSLYKFSFVEWVTLKPISFLWKELRNDLFLFFYKRLVAKNETVFLEQNNHLKNKNILAIIAFEQPQVLEWLFQLAQKNLSGAQLMVFDNSRRAHLSAEIERVCQRYDIPYLALPNNPTRHVNRSHGMAMTWVYYRIIKKIQPKYFGYIDHDLLPIEPVDINESLNMKNGFYGLLRKKAGYWNLWAGYAFYSYEAIKDLPMNWLYDFSRLLDTGGRNWNCLYSKLEISQAEADLAKDIFYEATLQEYQAQIQVIDRHWLHIGGVGYNNNFAKKEEIFTQIVSELLAGKSPEAVLHLKSV
jgi:hypothetical protein